jgi:SAM-dependent methyltransferase
VRQEESGGAFWGQHLPDLSENFYGFPALRGYFYSCITGETSSRPLERDWFEEWTVDTFLKDVVPVEECLSLCCGFGEIERILARRGVFKRCTGIDIAERALEEAKKRASDEGLQNIDYRCADINSITLGADQYDLIWANGALHHLSNLERVLSEIQKALKPGGLLVCNEYIGPKHQQLELRHREIVNSAIHLIPHRLRQSSEDTFIPTFFKGPKILRRLYQLLSGKVDGERLSSHSLVEGPLFLIFRMYQRGIRSLTGLGRPFRYGKVWDVNKYYYRKIDPTEGVRADEIITMLESTFGQIDCRYYNGSILLFALDNGFYDRYDDENPEDRAVLNMLIGMERALIEAGELKPVNAHILARKSISIAE